MKLVRVTKKHTKKSDADWRAYKDPVAVLKRDFEVFVKECKDAKKKADALIDKGEYFQLKDAISYFDRSLILSKELFRELRDAYTDKQYQKVAYELLDKFDEVDKKLKEMVSNLNIVVNGLNGISPFVSALRKSYF